MALAAVGAKRWASAGSGGARLGREQQASGSRLVRRWCESVSGSSELVRWCVREALAQVDCGGDADVLAEDAGHGLRVATDGGG